MRVGGWTRMEMKVIEVEKNESCEQSVLNEWPTWWLKPPRIMVEFGVDRKQIKKHRRLCSSRTGKQWQREKVSKIEQISKEKEFYIRMKEQQLRTGSELVQLTNWRQKAQGNEYPLLKMAPKGAYARRKARKRINRCIKVVWIYNCLKIVSCSELVIF